MIGPVNQTLKKLGAEGRRLIRWWFDVLRDMGRASRAALGELWPRGVVTAEEAEWRLWRVQSGRARLLHAWPQDERPEAVQARIADQKSLQSLIRRGVRLGIPESEAYRITLRVPQVAESNLSRLVALHLERALPMRAESALVDWRIARRLRAERQLELDILVAHRFRIEQLRRSLEDGGFRVTSVGCAQQGGAVLGQFALPQSDTPRQHLVTRGDQWLARLAVVLTLALPLLVGWHWFEERRSVNQALENLSGASAKTRADWSSLTDLAGRAQSLAVVMAQPTAGETLEHLTRELPSDVWSYELLIEHSDTRPTQLELTGFATSAAELVISLEESSHFERIQLVNATPDGPTSGRERLQLRFDREVPTVQGTGS